MGQRISEKTVSVVFDRAFFEHCTMSDKQLMGEVLSLFRVQVEGAAAEFGLISDKNDWKFQAHRLKGAAAAVGAVEIQMIAASWENHPMPRRFSEREALVESLRQATKAYFSEADKVIQ